MQALRDVQGNSYIDTSTNWRTIDPEKLCATINDYQSLMEKCDEFAEKVIHLVQEDDRESVSALMDELSSEYLRMGILTLNYFARRYIIAGYFLVCHYGLCPYTIR